MPGATPGRMRASGSATTLAAEYWASGSARSASSAKRGTWLLVLDLAWVRWERPLAVDIPRDRGFSGQRRTWTLTLG